MKTNEYNNDFFGYNGYINRKNYIINILILTALYISTMLVNFESFIRFTEHKFLLQILLFLVNLFQFVILISGISVVYRRIADISQNRTLDFFENAKKIFTIIVVFPVLYLYCIRYFLDFMPLVVRILDLLVVFILLPICFIGLICLCFLKKKE